MKQTKEEKITQKGQSLLEFLLLLSLILFFGLTTATQFTGVISKRWKLAIAMVISNHSGQVKEEISKLTFR